MMKYSYWNIEHGKRKDNNKLESKQEEKIGRMKKKVDLRVELNFHSKYVFRRKKECYTRWNNIIFDAFLLL